MQPASEQLWLPFEKSEEEKKIQPPKFEQPKNDNERLLNYQYEIKNGNQAAFDGMYKLGRTVALKYINNAAKKNKMVAALSYEEKKEKAHNAITYIVSRYLQVEDFCINTSFTSYIFLRVKHELYYKRKVDDLVDFMDLNELKGVKQ